jgi:membrane fusion protein, multidrug efflux system
LKQKIGFKTQKWPFKSRRQTDAMNKIVKRIVSLLVIVLIVALAFYPKLKGYFSKKEGDGKGKTEQMSASGKGEGRDEKGNKGDGNKGEKGKGGGGPGGKGGPTPVEVMVIASQRIEDKILTTGTIIPNEEVEVRSEISGRITAINFKEGEYVSKGTVLIRINDADLQAQLNKLGFQKKLAQVNEERQRKLLEKEAISQREYDISITNLNSIGADIENLQAQIAKTVIRAPFNGQIGLRYVSLGSYLSPATRITTLTNLVPVKIDFSVPAKYANIVRKGTNITFTTENDDDKHSGSVYAVETKIDPNTRTVMLRATSPNNSRRLVPGAFARIEIVLSSKLGAILVPTEAVVPDMKGHKVFVVRNSKAEPVTVDIGNRTDSDIVITKGLSVGDTLITSGVSQVKPGGDVDIRGVKN